MYKKYQQVPLKEIQERLTRFRAVMDQSNPEWEMVAVFSKINIYYFTGTLQEGMLLIPRDGEAVLFIRRSYDRAVQESLFPVIKPMNSFRDALAYISQIPKTCHIEAEIIPVAFLQRFQKYVPFQNVQAADKQINYVRSIKSPFELSLMEESGKIHRYVLEECVPGILREGRSEADLVTELYSVLIKEGHHGVSRFAMFDTEMGVGQIGFGENSIYPNFFNGPGGNLGLSPAVPVIGSRERKLKKGDLVFVDIGCGVDGYHTDKTMTYMFGAAISDKAVSYHEKCVEIQHTIAGMLKPGNRPEDIYRSVMNSLDADFLENFMGFGNRRVKFLGHGIGLHIDEYPVIAEGFSEPLEEGMVLAVEPKKGIAGVGMVGIENTFVVTPQGGRCITGDHPGLMPV